MFTSGAASGATQLALGGGGFSATLTALSEQRKDDRKYLTEIGQGLAKATSLLVQSSTEFKSQIQQLTKAQQAQAEAQQDQAKSQHDQSEAQQAAIADLTATVESLVERQQNGGGSSRPSVPLTLLTSGIGPLVYPKLPLLFDTLNGLMVWCPVTSNIRGVPTETVVFSVTAAKYVLLEWDSNLKKHNLELFLGMIVPMEVQLNKNESDMCSSDFDTFIGHTPFKTFQGKKKNPKAYFIVPKDWWRRLMNSIEATDFGTEQPKEIPPTLLNMKVIGNMMTQQWAMKPDDETKYADGPVTAVVSKTKHKTVSLYLSLKQRMTRPAFKKTWWDELYEHGVADYFGIDMGYDFNHIRSGKMQDFDANMPKSEPFATHFEMIQNDVDDKRRKEKKKNKGKKKAVRDIDEDDGEGHEDENEPKKNKKGKKKAVRDVDEDDGEGDEEENENPSPKRRKK